MMMDEAALEALRGAAVERAEGGVTYRCLALARMRELASELGLSNRELSALALENGLLPLRYLKNIGTLGLDGQAKLLRSKAVIIGAGGIGGQAAELLVRMGIGTLVLVDPDVFDETNLNRQNFACGDVLGMAKVDVVRDRLLEINHDVEVTGMRVTADRDNLPGLIEGASVVIDALDNLDDRLVLQEACARSGVVMVHGAIAGSSLQATTIYPGDRGLADFAPLTRSGEKTRGIELETGNPATTPTMAAVIQVQEAVNVVLGRSPSLRGRMLYLDLEDLTMEFIELSE
jgi:molybdopterin/thiamine biosynthesis adenylyltransferase